MAPERAVVGAAALEARAMEQVRLALAVARDFGAPPVREAVARRVGIQMIGKLVIILVGVELHEQRHLLEVVQALRAFGF